MSRSPSLRAIAMAGLVAAAAGPAVSAAQRKPAAPPAATTPQVDSAALKALTWRNIGPFRGGRATTVTGVPAQPLVYYMGATGGGIWKTEDGGQSWRPVADGQIKMGSVGAIAVAQNDPNVTYAGMGEAPVRGVSSSWGDGVYRSTDAGKTWSSVGLTGARQISRVAIHPRNADLVYVAAQGSRWGPSRERGVYRSGDGGMTWKQVLAVDSSSGPSDLAMDPGNPRVLYAAMWDHQRLPWYARSGGPGSGIWKTTDGGDTWTRLSTGLPKLMGKIGVAVSPPNPERVWAIIEADSGGLFRSDDGGKSWRLVNGDRVLRARAWYYTRVTADPRNPDVVYVINAPLLKSVDAGKTFVALPDPHGDNHDLWVNPENPANLAKADDGGAAISFTGGKTWSTLMNQPTAQFYRVNTDDRFPYWVYAGQQDNSTVATPSSAAGPGIDLTDWHEVGGCESAHVAFDPADPKYVYAGCYHGQITEYDAATRATRNVMAYPFLGLGEPSDQMKYRWNWSAPIATSPHDRRVIYHAANQLFRSSDRGQSWTAISPDLTRNDKAKQGRGGGPITNEGAGGEVYGTIYYVVESPHEAGTIWVGTDDGLVQLTRDGGKSWSNVTPKGLPESLINSLEVSPHDRATAYVAVSRHKWNDNTPQLFRTSDYGQTWAKQVNGIPDGDVVRVVREDPNRRGLLYAGTETGAWISFDAGGRWQSLQLNLPHVPVTDLQIKRRDLVAATEGRAFWILDDLSPLYQVGDSVLKAAVHLFQPRNVYRTNLGSNGDPPPSQGRSAPAGALVYYYLGRAPDSGTAVKLEFADRSGALVRSFSNAPVAPGDSARRIRLLPGAGLNRFTWDLRHEPLERVPGVMLAEGAAGAGYRVAPGSYEVRLTLGGEVRKQSLEVLADPRTGGGLAAEDLKGQQELLAQVSARINQIHVLAKRLRSVREQINALVERAGMDTLTQVGKALVRKVDAAEERLINPRSKTFQDVINFRNGINDQYLNLADAVDGTDAPVTQGMRIRLADLEAMWAQLRPEVEAILGAELDRFNALVRERGVPAIVAK